MNKQYIVRIHHIYQFKVSKKAKTKESVKTILYDIQFLTLTAGNQPNVRHNRWKGVRDEG